MCNLLISKVVKILSKITWITHDDHFYAYLPRNVKDDGPSGQLECQLQETFSLLEFNEMAFPAIPIA